MSRKGKQPIPLPSTVAVSHDGGLVTVKGPKATLTLSVKVPVIIDREGEFLKVDVPPKVRDGSRWHGLYRSLIANMVTGSHVGFQKILELKGVGYRAIVKGRLLELQLGFSQPKLLTIPEGIEVVVDKSLVTVKGWDKQKVGLFAATVRALRPPEPYKGKGIRYQDEYVRRKAGKAGGKK